MLWQCHGILTPPLLGFGGVLVAYLLLLFPVLLHLGIDVSVLGLGKLIPKDIPERYKCLCIGTPRHPCQTGGVRWKNPFVPLAAKETDVGTHLLVGVRLRGGLEVRCEELKPWHLAHLTLHTRTPLSSVRRVNFFPYLFWRYCMQAARLEMFTLVSRTLSPGSSWSRNPYLVEVVATGMPFSILGVSIMSSPSLCLSLNNLGSRKTSLAGELG